MNNKLFNEKRERYYHRQVIKAIGLENTPIAFGAEKTCHIFNNFVVFKEQIDFNDADLFHNSTVLKLIKFQNLQYLANAGINTPRIVDIEYRDKFIFEIQERAPGQVLSYTNESNILHSFGGKDNVYLSIKDMSDALRSQFCKQVLDYNFNMQKKLKSAPISHFVKFLSDFKDIQEYGLDLDIHGENFLYDTSKGFYFVDLPILQSTQKKKFNSDNIDNVNLLFNNKKIKSIDRYRELSDYEILRQVCNLFVDFLKYSSFVFDLDLVKQMKKNNASIIENKIFPAAKKLGFHMTDDEWDRLLKHIDKFTQKKRTTTISQDLSL
ncbi:MAG: hypothetical protein IJ415_00460 [Clostridia bacterium]|nr:hypothetical protein [Clostridia bacterium]